MHAPADTPFVLITGGSGGIGLELALLFARDRYAIGLAARSADRMRTLAERLRMEGSPRVDVYPVDLAAPDAAAALWNRVVADHPDVDVLVNNAGFASSGPFHEQDWNVFSEMIRLNVLTLTQLTHLALGAMTRRGRGKILNVASTAAFQAGPQMGVYFATKAFVLHFSEAIAEELEGSGVTVTALCPGATHTGFQERAGMEGSNLFKGPNVLDAATVARVGYRAMQKGRRVRIVGAINKVLIFLTRVTPRKWTNKVVEALQ